MSVNDSDVEKTATGLRDQATRNSDRQREISKVFVSMAGSLARGTDVLDLMSELTADCARLLDIEAAGLLLVDRQGVLQIAATSSESLRVLEVFQLQSDEGPCLDCYRSGEPISVESLPEAASRWPQFTVAAATAGFEALHAVPMRWRDQRLGSLGLFGSAAGVLNEDDLKLAQAFADVASVAVSQDIAAVLKDALTGQLQTALDSRVLVEQAKGILAEHGNLDMDDAFKALRRYCRNNNYKLKDVAASLVSRTLPPGALLDATSATKSTDS